MVMKKINKNQVELGIKTYDYNVPTNHISRFVVEFIEEVYPILGIKENKKKRGRPSYPPCSMLKLLVYAKLTILEVQELLKKWQSTMIYINLFVTELLQMNAQFKGIEMI